MIIYVVYQKIPNTYSYDGIVEELDSAYVSKDNAQRRVDEINSGLSGYDRSYRAFIEEVKTKD